MNRFRTLLILSLTCFAQLVYASGLAPKDARLAAQGAVAEVLDALVHKNFQKLATYVGSEGLAVSPYVTLHDATMRLSRAEVRRCANDSRIRHWGEMDGTGDSIESTCRSYFNKFVWDADYRKADEILYNEPRQRGSDINNNHEFASGDIVVELHIRSKSTKAEMDWRSLRLIFRKGNHRLTLIAITRDIWTI